MNLEHLLKKAQLPADFVLFLKQGWDGMGIKHKAI